MGKAVPVLCGGGSLGYTEKVTRRTDAASMDGKD